MFVTAVHAKPVRLSHTLGWRMMGMLAAPPAGAAGSSSGIATAMPRTMLKPSIRRLRPMLGEPEVGSFDVIANFSLELPVIKLSGYCRRFGRQNRFA